MRPSGYSSEHLCPKMFLGVARGWGDGSVPTAAEGVRLPCHRKSVGLKHQGSSAHVKAGEGVKTDHIDLRQTQVLCGKASLVCL